MFFIICLLVVLAKKLICVRVQAACETSETMQEAGLGTKLKIYINLYI